MANPTPQQIAWQGRFEALIGLAAPALALVLAAGGRISRLLGPEDEYYPIRSPGEALELGRAGSPPPDPSAGPGAA